MRSMADCLACGWNSHEPDGSDEHARSIAVHREHFCKGDEQGTREYAVKYTHRQWGEGGALETEERYGIPWKGTYTYAMGCANREARRMNKIDPSANAVVVTRTKTVVISPWKETS